MEEQNNKYIVRYENNNSKRWDGKEVWLDAEIIDELYESSELFHGANIVVPWKYKGGKITHWKAIFIDPKAVQPAESGKNCLTNYLSLCNTHCNHYCESLLSNKVKAIYIRYVFRKLQCPQQWKMLHRMLLTTNRRKHANGKKHMTQQLAVKFQGPQQLGILHSKMLQVWAVMTTSTRNHINVKKK